MVRYNARDGAIAAYWTQLTVDSLLVDGSPYFALLRGLARRPRCTVLAFVVDPLRRAFSVVTRGRCWTGLEFAVGLGTRLALRNMRGSSRASVFQSPTPDAQVHGPLFRPRVSVTSKNLWTTLSLLLGLVFDYLIRTNLGKGGLAPRLVQG